jgi:hypothetical protein
MDEPNATQALQDAMFANIEAGMPLCANEYDHYWIGSFGNVTCAICLDTRGNDTSTNSEGAPS